jgi:hypothetical protein
VRDGVGAVGAGDSGVSFPASRVAELEQLIAGAERAGFSRTQLVEALETVAGGVP